MRVHALVVVAMLCQSGCSGPYSNPSVAAKEAVRPVQVKVVTVRMQSMPEVVTATGELYAQDVATLNAKVVGRLENITVDIGSRVQPGQVLAEIDKVEYEARVQQSQALIEQSRARLGLKPGSGDQVDPAATATVRQAAATLEEARLNFGRLSQLFQQGILSRSEFDRGDAALRLAEARHDAAIEEIYQVRAQLSERRAQLVLARKQLEETVLRAPFEGAVTQRQAAVGEFLNVGSPVVTVVRVHPLRLRLEIPERLAHKARIGQPIQVRLEDARIRAGTIVRISPSIDAQNRSLLVEGEIPNQDGVLKPGSFAEGIITVDPYAQGIAVPASAVVSFAGVDRVYVLQNGTLAERVVKLGRRLDGKQIEILSGVTAGETVVARADDRLANGQPAQAIAN